MRRLKCLVVIGALTIAVSAVAAGPAAAAKGGNNDTAKQCQKGGWKTLASPTGEPFKNQATASTTGPRALAPSRPPPVRPRATTSTQRLHPPRGRNPVAVRVPGAPNPAGPLSALQDACASDSGRPDSQVLYEVHAGETTATCLN